MILSAKIKELSRRYFLFSCILIFFAGHSSVSLSQVDTEFWFVVPELSHRLNTGGTPGTMRISTLELPATVTISMPANPYHPILNPGGFQEIVVDLAANTSAAVDLTAYIDVAASPANNRLENKPLTLNGINNFGLHITSTNMITAYWEVNYAFGSDLWTLKGRNGLGTLFYTPFQTFYNNRNLTPRTYSAIDIVATTDNTQVTITLPAGKAASYGSGPTGIVAGGTYILTLNSGQTFSLFPVNYSILATDRLAGTRIESTEPVAVTLKDDALAVGPQGQDVIGDQIVPVNIVGNNYIVPDMGNPNHVYVLATEDNTNIYVYDGAGIPIGATPYTTLNRGQQALVVVPGGSKFAHITSSLNPADPVKPIYVFQLGVENQQRGGAIVPAIGCTGNTQLAFTRARAGENKFQFFIIIKKGNEDKFLIDGVRDDGIIDPGAFTEIPGTGGYMAWFSNSIPANTLTIGQHLVENTGDIFHLGIFNGNPGAGQAGLYYGYYSDFGGLNVGANVAGTNSSVVRACYGDPVQLYAYGGTTYLWTPDTYLDDATSNMPTAINLPPGAHIYTVDVSGTCSSGSIDLTVLVSTPVVAFFETDVSSGCSPLEVNIDDRSSGGFSWQYDLGDGSPLIRYDLDPLTPYNPPPGYPAPFSFTHTYTNTTILPIDNTVTLLVKNESGCSDIFTKTITVFPEIHSDFSVVGATAGCDPLLVQFQNNSTGNTDAWYWEFGDGGSSVDENPQHTFRNQFGPDNLIFQTRMITVSPYLCRDTLFQTITVSPYIEANFVFDTVYACTPHQIVITDQSIGVDTYSWDFGDGTISSSPGTQIIKTYINSTPLPVTYTIRLRVDNEEGCFDEIQRDVTVYPEINASFTPSTVEGCSPFEVSFQNNSSGAAFYFWDFGDGGTSTEADPVHLYDKNLMDHDTIYTVTLISTSAQFCRDTAYIDILVHPYLEAAFAVNDILGCHPFTITIENQAFGAEQYFWDFGDGTLVSTTTLASFDHTYYNTGSAAVVYPLQLTVLNSEGCSDVLTVNITVHPEMTANFTASTFEGCHPLTVTFTDLSQNAVTYYWDFGDGASSTQSSPVHIFTNFGISDSTYMVTLTTSTGDGECVKSVSWPVVVHPQVESEFNLLKVLDCTPFDVIIYNSSVNATIYRWDFGDGTDTVTYTTDPFTHRFINTSFTAQADYEITLVAENPAGCSSESRRTITVEPDINAEFTPNLVEGCHPLTVDFTNISSGATYYLWDFGNGTTSQLTNPSQTFTNIDSTDVTYQVWLYAMASNFACLDSFYIDIVVHPYIHADFTFVEYVDCTPFTVQFSNASTAGGTYHWDFGDGSDTTTTNLNPVSHVFNNSSYVSNAVLQVTLTAENPEGCTSQMIRTLEVYPDIEALYSVNTDEGCHPLKVNFTNQSSGGFTYLWDFGDGTSSSADSPDHTYTNYTNAPITRQVRLTATSRFNCVSEITGNITIHPKPLARYETDKIIDCPPFDVLIINTSTNADQYIWNFGDGDTLATNSMIPFSHTYDNLTNNIATYNIKLIAASTFGCVDSSRQNIYVYPRTVADFSFNDEGCSPLTSYFTNESVRGDTYLWDFGDGSNISIKDPSHTYFNFTDADISYYVTLTSTSRYGCTDSRTDTVYVYAQPAAEFIVLPTHQVFPSATVSFTNATNPGPWTYLWDMDDGSTSTLENPLPYTYALWGEYDIKLYAASAHCLDSVSHLIRIFASPPIADFDTIIPGCEPLTVQFRNTSLYGDSYLWEFDDNTSSTDFEPSHTFSEYGIYNVKLTVTGDGGRDYAYHQVEVYRKPLVNFRVAPELVMLPEQEIQLYNLSEYGTFWSWDFGDGTTSSEYNPTYRYKAEGTYDITLEVWTENGCSDTLTKPAAVTVVPTGLIVFPNVFEPEMSGPNGGYYDLSEPELDNIFHPVWEGVDKYRLEIYNRWGVLIYISEEVMKGWDGYYQGKVAQQGVYVYKCTGTFSNGKPFTHVGDVTLLHHYR